MRSRKNISRNLLLFDLPSAKIYSVKIYNSENIWHRDKGLLQRVRGSKDNTIPQLSIKMLFIICFKENRLATMDKPELPLI